MFIEDLNTINDGEIHDKVFFKQGVWCSQSWLNAPFGLANIPAGNKIFCCQPGSYLRCSCPDLLDTNKENQDCCPTTDYSVVRRPIEFIDGAMFYNTRIHSDFIASPSDCVLCLPGQYTDDLNLKRTTCHACPEGWYQDEAGKPYCLPCERKYSRNL